MIHATAQRKNQPAAGRFWIEPATGRVLVSELTVGDRNMRATIDVSFQSEPLLDMLVPVAMRERYEARRSKTILEGRATYGRFRLSRPLSREEEAGSSAPMSQSSAPSRPPHQKRSERRT